MPKAFSVASWNVRNLGDDATQVSRVVEYLVKQAPDVFALYEVAGKTVFEQMVALLPAYSFHITEGVQAQEILLGVRGGLTAFFTQRLEFKERQATLRPGAILTITLDGEHYCLLFLHTKSDSTPFGLGLRDDQFARALKFKKSALEKQPRRKPANYIFLGDLNSMGMDYPFGKSIAGEDEVKKLAADAEKVGMRLLRKTADSTYWSGPADRFAPGNLDQVVAAKHLQFMRMGTASDGCPAEVAVRGWASAQRQTEQAAWIRGYSDHNLLYFELQKL